MKDPDASKEQAEVERKSLKARAEWAVARIRKQSRLLGLDSTSMDEIVGEIQTARKARKRGPSEPH